ncbi:MAG: AAA family ATPase [Deltaproteobacteria bacterium]|jgi:hypothetical protein|nr:AAA family ATPase [Deltaproteobacteria bacterium]
MDFARQLYLRRQDRTSVQPARTKKTYFPARPRLFGKSLVRTSEAILKGKQELFEGLWIRDRSDYD